MSGQHHRPFLDPFNRIDSPMQVVPPAVKLFTAVALFVAFAFVPVRPVSLVTFYPMAAVFLIGVCGLSLLPPGPLLRRVIVMEPVVLAVAVMALLGPGGVRLFLTLCLRGTFCLVTAMLLASTTPMTDLLAVLRRLRTPAVVLTTLARMYRYLFLLSDEAQRMRRARRSRTFSASARVEWRIAATTVGHLFVRTLDRAERVYCAMCARGWQ